MTGVAEQILYTQREKSVRGKIRIDSIRQFQLNAQQSSHPGFHDEIGDSCPTAGDPEYYLIMTHSCASSQSGLPLLSLQAELIKTGFENPG